VAYVIEQGMQWNDEDGRRRRLNQKFLNQPAPLCHGVCCAQAPTFKHASNQSSLGNVTFIVYDCCTQFAVGEKQVIFVGRKTQRKTLTSPK
jgi:hypothetical protein